MDPDGRHVAVELAGAELDVLADLRSRARELLADVDPGPGTVETTTLVLTELATNALVHGAPPGQCRLQVAPGLARIEVDDTSAAPAAVAADLPRPAGGGRGLALVEKLTSCWGQRPTAHGKTVWAEVALEAPETNHGHDPAPPPVGV